jgi:hypothetical protein
VAVSGSEASIGAATQSPYYNLTPRQIQAKMQDLGYRINSAFKKTAEYQKIKTNERIIMATFACAGVAVAVLTAGMAAPLVASGYTAAAGWVSLGAAACTTTACVTTSLASNIAIFGLIMVAGIALDIAVRNYLESFYEAMNKYIDDNKQLSANLLAIDLTKSCVAAGASDERKIQEAADIAFKKDKWPGGYGGIQHHDTLKAMAALEYILYELSNTTPEDKAGAAANPNRANLFDIAAFDLSTLYTEGFLYDRENVKETVKKIRQHEANQAKNKAPVIRSSF